MIPEVLRIEFSLTRFPSTLRYIRVERVSVTLLEKAIALSPGRVDLTYVLAQV